MHWTGSRVLVGVGRVLGLQQRRCDTVSGQLVMTL